MRRKRSLAIEALEDRLCLTMSLPAPTVINLPTNVAWTAPNSPFYGSPIFADLNGEGNQELLFEETGGRLAAYQQTASGYSPYMTYTATPMANGKTGDFQSTPVVVNAPGIGPVIVAALGRDQPSSGTLEDGRVFAFNAKNGHILWTFNTGLTTLPGGANYPYTGVTGALTIGYLQNNGIPYVIVDSFSHLVSAINVTNGKTLWQYNNDDTVEGGAVVADLYGDGNQDVIYASGISPSTYYPAGGYITILNPDGSLLRRIYVPGAIFGSPLVVDLFGNGQKEIVVAPNDYFDKPEPAGNWNPSTAQEAAFTAAANRVYAYYPNGALVNGWPYKTTSNDTQDASTWKELSAADLYGNGQTEILDIDRLGTLHVILPTGQDAPGFVGGKSLGNTGSDVWGSPIVAPIDGSGQQDIVVSDYYRIGAYDPSGNLLFSDYAAPLASGYPGQIFSAAAYGQFTPGGRAGPGLRLDEQCRTDATGNLPALQPPSRRHRRLADAPQDRHRSGRPALDAHRDCGHHTLV